MKPTGSIERVEQAAAEAGLAIEVKRMGASTRTAEEAAEQCGCAVGQIAKSLVFEGFVQIQMLENISGNRREEFSDARFAVIRRIN